MNRIMSAIMLSVLSACSKPVPAVEASSVENYLRQHGWKRFDTQTLPKSPVPEVAPIMFYDRGNSVPSCGLLAASGNGKEPEFIELVGSEPGVGYPQCLNIATMTRFKLQNKDYLVIDYLSRETREDVDRRFHYLVRISAQRFVTDETLTKAAPVTSEQGGTMKPLVVKTTDGVRFARLANLGKSQPTWRLLERDFISDKSSSFATFEDKKGQRCQFVTDAGGEPVATSYTVFAANTKCDAVLASGRYEKGGKTYYLAMFKTQDKKQLVGVTSVSSEGSILVEKQLAESINHSGVIGDMKTAKAVLARIVP